MLGLLVYFIKKGYTMKKELEKMHDLLNKLSIFGAIILMYIMFSNIIQ
jgi:hypothetical protein